MTFENIKRYYDNGLWTIGLVRLAVKHSWITAEQFAEITGENY